MEKGLSRRTAAEKLSKILNQMLIAMKTLLWLAILSVSILFPGTAGTSNAADTLQVAVAVSPQTLLLNKVQSGYVTVHVSIAYRLVDKESISMNGLEALRTFADDRGELVAKFSEKAVEDLARESGGKMLRLTLFGLTTEGRSFSGTDTVKVR